jgi:hypothetical protein
VVLVVGVVVLLGSLGLVVLRQTDPQGARDRDAAKSMLLTTSDVGPGWTTFDSADWAATRAGLRADTSDPLLKCVGDDSALVTHGTGGAYSNLVNGEVTVGSQVFFVDAEAAAASTMTALGSPEFAACFNSAVRDMFTKAVNDPSIAFDIAAEPIVVAGAGYARRLSLSAAGIGTVFYFDVVVVQSARIVGTVLFGQGQAPFPAEQESALVTMLLARMDAGRSPI